MSLTYITVDDAVHRAGEEEFWRNVRRAVIPRLIAKGLLHGKQYGERQLVADDDALARLERLGVEKFVQNQQGYSFMCVRAPVEDVSRRLATRPGVASYEENVEPLPMNDEVGLQPDEKVRQAFLLGLRDSPEWSVLIETVHWFQSCDAVMVTALASVLSRDLHTTAAAAWDDDFSGSSLIVCEQGERQAELSEEAEDWETFYEFFYEQGIYLPQSFIGTEDGRATLYIADPAAVRRADRVALKVPAAVESTGPHVFEKFGMMAQALAEDIDDEDEFMARMRGGIWRQAQAMLASGQF